MIDSKRAELIEALARIGLIGSIKHGMLDSIFIEDGEVDQILPRVTEIESTLTSQGSELTRINGVVVESNTKNNEQDSRLTALENGTTNAIPTSEKAAANGVATLDASGVVPLEQLNVSGLGFKGAWNAATNNPSLVDGTGSVGDFYKVSTAGTFNFGNGAYTFAVGDWVMFAAGVWQRIGVHEAVSSVNGKVGAVQLTAADVGALPNTYQAPVESINGKTGVVSLTASDVGALPSNYSPPNATWETVSGKPDLAALYQPKQRGAIGPAIPGVLLRKNVNQNISNSGIQVITWDAAVWNQFGGFVDGGSEITVPSWAKYFRASGRLQFWGNSSGFRQCGVQVNGVTVPGTAWEKDSPSAATPLTLTISTAIVPCVSGDKLRVAASQSSGGTLAVEGTPTGTLSWVQFEFFE